MTEKKLLHQPTTLVYNFFMLSLKKKYQVLKSDRVLFSIFLIHLLLAFFHIAYSFYSEHNQCYIRCGFCLLIAFTTYLFLRKGFSISILIYSYMLLYFNNFYNYTSFLFVLFAIYCSPKISKPALIGYTINVFIALAMKNSALLTLGIHGLNCFLFYCCAKYLFQAITPSTLLLTDDERKVLGELSKGKLQKQIDLFSQNTITKIIRNAMERNLCKTKNELIQKYIKENPTESQDGAI